MVAATAVPLIPTLAAAIPVGAKALTCSLCTKHHKNTVDSKKLFPVPAEACTMSRRGLPDFFFSAWVVQGCAIKK